MNNFQREWIQRAELLVNTEEFFILVFYKILFHLPLVVSCFFCVFFLFCCCSGLTDECSRLIKVFLLRWKSYDFTSDGTVRIKGAGALACASLVPTCRDHCDESCRTLQSLTAERKLFTRAQNNTVSVITITAIVIIIFIIIIIIIIVISQLQPGRPAVFAQL